MKGVMRRGACPFCKSLDTEPVIIIIRYGYRKKYGEDMECFSCGQFFREHFKGRGLVRRLFNMNKWYDYTHTTWENKTVAVR